MRFEQIGNALLFNADCLDVMPGLPQVDMVLTDPPYNVVNRESGGLRKLDKGLADSAPVDIERLVSEVSRLNATSAYFWCSTEQVSEYRSKLVDAGWATRQAVWHKSNPSPMNGQHLWLSAVELCVFGRRKGAAFTRKCAHPVFKWAITRNKYHPTEKPLGLMEELIDASSIEGQTVLDPFMGGGTTGVACARLDRNFIGIELDPEYFDIAVDRIRGVLS